MAVRLVHCKKWCDSACRGPAAVVCTEDRMCLLYVVMAERDNGKHWRPQQLGSLALMSGMTCSICTGSYNDAICCCHRCASSRTCWTSTLATCPSCQSLHPSAATCAPLWPTPSATGMPQAATAARAACSSARPAGMMRRALLCLTRLHTQGHRGDDGL